MVRSGCFFCKQKTAYEMRISDWSSDVCSSDLELVGQRVVGRVDRLRAHTPFSLVHRLADLADIPLVVELARGEHVVEVALATGLEAGPVAPLVRVAHARVEGLPLLQRLVLGLRAHPRQVLDAQLQRVDRKSTRLNSSH